VQSHPIGQIQFGEPGLHSSPQGQHSHFDNVLFDATFFFNVAFANIIVPATKNVAKKLKINFFIGLIF